MNKVDFEIDAINKVDRIKQLALRLCTSVGLKADNLYDAGLIHDLASQVFYILDGVLSAKSEENENDEEQPDGLPPNEGIITFEKKNVGYDWWDVERDGLPELEHDGFYIYTYILDDQERAVDCQGEELGVIDGVLYDGVLHDGFGDRVVRICKARQGD